MRFSDIRGGSIDAVKDALSKIDGARSLADAGRLANEHLSEPKTAGAWRGIFHRNPDLAQLVRDGIAESFTNGDIPFTIDGVTAEDYEPDVDELFADMVRWSRKSAEFDRRRLTQRIEYGQPWCWVFMSDLHIDNSGTDIERLFAETEFIRTMPNTHVCFLGDLTDSFIAKWCASIRHNTKVTIEEAHALGLRWMETVGDQLIAVCGGNHDYWSKKESGVDILRNQVRSLGHNILYDPDEIYVTLSVGGREFRVRVRHSFKGSSIYSATHGIERAAKFDQALPFELGVQGHTHRSGVARHFNNGGDTGLAILCGAYKRRDSFARRIGFAKPNEDCAIAVVFHPELGMVAFQRLEAAKLFMEAL